MNMAVQKIYQISTEVSCVGKCQNIKMEDLLRKRVHSAISLCQSCTTSCCWPHSSRTDRPSLSLVSNIFNYRLQWLAIRVLSGDGKEGQVKQNILLVCFSMLFIDCNWHDTANVTVTFSHKAAFIISEEKVGRAIVNSCLIMNGGCERQDCLQHTGMRTWQESPVLFICFRHSEEGKLLFFPFLFLCLEKSVASPEIYILTYVNLLTVLCNISLQEPPCWEMRLQEQRTALFTHLTLVTYQAGLIKQLLKSVSPIIMQCCSQYGVIFFN